MGVKKGYKLTEVGVIPEDWEVGLIGSIASVHTGSKNTQDRIENGKYPFFVRSQKVEHINTYSFDGEAILTAGDGVGTGKIFHYINGKFDVHQRVYMINNFSEKIYGYYFYLFFSFNFYNRIMQMTAKSSVDSVRRTMIADMPIAIPSHAEQTAIATVLSDVDALLTSLDALISKKRDMKQAAMQELLTGRRRLLANTKEWRSTFLGELGECIRGVSFDGENDVCNTNLQNTYQLLRANNIQNFSLDFQNVLYVYDYCVSEKQKLQHGDIIICMANGSRELVGKSAIYTLPDNHNFTFGAFMSCFRPRSNDSNPGYINFVLQTDDFRKYVELTLSGSSINNLKPGDIENYSFTIPNLAEQAAIATVLADMDAEIAALEARRAKTQALKQGMMQDLLTGRFRLKPAHGDPHA